MDAAVAYFDFKKSAFLSSKENILLQKEIREYNDR
jgi:hypothetical protein